MLRATTRWTDPRLALAAVGLLVAAATAAPPHLALAAPAAKANVVQTVLAAAQKAFDAGDFVRAGELFLEVWRSDPDARPVLYNAARAFQLAGKADKAEQLFDELRALPDLDTVLRVKANTQLAVLRASRAERVAEQAAQAEREGQHAVAAVLWADAWTLQPDKVAWLARQARSLQRAGQLAEAAAVYDRYLEQAATDAPGRAEAEAWRKQLPAAKVATTPARPEPAVVKAPESDVAAPLVPPLLVAPQRPPSAAPHAPDDVPRRPSETADERNVRETLDKSEKLTHNWTQGVLLDLALRYRVASHDWYSGSLEYSDYGTRPPLPWLDLRIGYGNPQTWSYYVTAGASINNHGVNDGLSFAVGALRRLGGNLFTCSVGTIRFPGVYKSQNALIALQYDYWFFQHFGLTANAGLMSSRYFDRFASLGIVVGL